MSGIVVSKIVNGEYVSCESEADKAKYAERFADMLRSRRAPGQGGGNTSFMRGRQLNEDFAKLPKEMQQCYIKEAKEAGVDISGKFYHKGIARWPCDPAAWVNSTEDLTERAEARGLVLEGDINYSPSKESRRKRKAREDKRIAKERKERAVESAREQMIFKKKMESSK